MLRSTCSCRLVLATAAAVLVLMCPESALASHPPEVTVGIADSSAHAGGALPPAIGVTSVDAALAACLGSGIEAGEGVSVYSLVTRRAELSLEASESLTGLDAYKDALRQIAIEGGVDITMHEQRAQAAETALAELDEGLGMLGSTSGPQRDRLMVRMRSAYEVVDAAMRAAAEDERARKLSRDLDIELASVLAKRFPCHQVVQAAIEQRAKQLVVAERDLTGGAAALATILTHVFGRPTSELDLVGSLVSEDGKASGTSALVVSMSFVDLATWARARDVESAGVELDLATLQELRHPAILQLTRAAIGNGDPDDHGGSSFAVWRGIVNGKALIGDPLQGNLALSIEDFGSRWTGYALVLRSE